MCSVQGHLLASDSSIWVFYLDSLTELTSKIHAQSWEHYHTHVATEIVMASPQRQQKMEICLDHGTHSRLTWPMTQVDVELLLRLGFRVRYSSWGGCSDLIERVEIQCRMYRGCCDIRCTKTCNAFIKKRFEIFSPRPIVRHHAIYQMLSPETCLVPAYLYCIVIMSILSGPHVELHSSFFAVLLVHLNLHVSFHLTTAPFFVSSTFLRHRAYCKPCHLYWWPDWNGLPHKFLSVHGLPHHTQLQRSGRMDGLSWANQHQQKSGELGGLEKRSSAGWEEERGSCLVNTRSSAEGAMFKASWDI